MPRRALLPAAVAVCVVALAALLTLLARPPYVARAQVYFGPTATLDATATARVASYAELVDGRDGVRATAVPGSLVVRLSARDGDAPAAQRSVAAATRLLQSRATSLEPSSRGLSATVVEAPTRPTTRTPAPWGRNLLVGLVLGLAAGALAAVALARRPRRLRGREDVAAVVPTWTTAEVPVAGQVSALVGVADPAGAYADLATGLRYLDVDAEGTTLLLAASRSGSEATEVAVRLGRRLVDSGESVVLVDAALHAPAVADLLGLSPEHGLVSVLAGDDSLADAVQRHAPSGLAVLPAGPAVPDPTALVASRGLPHLLDELRREHSTVLVVGDPLALGDTTPVLARATDGVLLVLGERRDDAASLLRDVDALEARGARLRGVVLTRVAELPPTPVVEQRSEASVVETTPPPAAPDLVFPEPRPVAEPVPADRFPSQRVPQEHEDTSAHSLLDHFLADETPEQVPGEPAPPWAQEDDDAETIWRPRAR